jgi:hypothetical protein
VFVDASAPLARTHIRAFDRRAGNLSPVAVEDVTVDRTASGAGLRSADGAASAPQLTGRPPPIQDRASTTTVFRDGAAIASPSGSAYTDGATGGQGTSQSRPSMRRATSRQHRAGVHHRGHGCSVGALALGGVTDQLGAPAVVAAASDAGSGVAGYRVLREVP